MLGQRPEVSSGAPAHANAVSPDVSKALSRRMTLRRCRMPTNVDQQLQRAARRFGVNIVPKPDGAHPRAGVHSLAEARRRRQRLPGRQRTDAGQNIDYFEWVMGTPGAASTAQLPVYDRGANLLRSRRRCRFPALAVGMRLDAESSAVMLKFICSETNILARVRRRC